MASPDRMFETADRAVERRRGGDVALVEVARLQTDGEHIKAALADVRKDLREVRDRMIALEVNVAHLPTKGFIVAVVVGALTILGGLFTLAPQLQRLTGAPQAGPASPR